MSKLNLLDIAKRNGSDGVAGLIEQVIVNVPEVGKIPVRTIKGTTYKTLLRTGLPSAGFRKVNDGVDPSKSTYDSRLCECFLAGGRIEVDKALVAVDDGSNGNILETESKGVSLAALLTVGSQTIYGDAANSAGFSGFQNTVDASMVLDATGSTANTASSIYGIKLGDDAITYVMGNGGSMNLSPFREESIVGQNGKKLPGYVADLMFWIGLQTVNKYALGRIKNITAQSGHTVTDQLIAGFLMKFPVGWKPDYLLMDRRSAFQLQTSRSATTVNSGAKSSTGAEVFAPQPTESNGVPIVVTDSIVDIEAIA